MQISVVVPTYRRPELLLRCIRALITQRFKRDQFEIIIVSDGPDDSTSDLVRKYFRRRVQQVHYYALPEKKGPAAARNYGWLVARGELIAFTDDDCIPEKNWLQSFADAYKTSGTSAFTGRTVVPIAKRPTDYELNIANLQTADFITANCCCTKKALEMTGGFDEQFSMAWREDSDLEFKLMQEHIRIARVERAVVVHPVRKVRWGISIMEQKKTMYNALLYKKYPELYRQKIQQRPPVVYYATILSFLTFLGGLASGSKVVAVSGGSLWCGLTTVFIVRRLRHTSLSANHIAEMTVTSMVIPFLSIYWQAYGDFKFKTILI
jgi:glycosyltransferase involved in cell wall biosynthesis